MKYKVKQQHQRCAAQGRIQGPGPESATMHHQGPPTTRQKKNIVSKNGIDFETLKKCLVFLAPTDAGQKKLFTIKNLSPPLDKKIMYKAFGPPQLNKIFAEILILVPGATNHNGPRAQRYKIVLPYSVTPDLQHSKYGPGAAAALPIHINKNR